MRCLKKDLLLKAIKVDKIVGKAAQRIRHISIESYVDLHDVLRSNVTSQVTSDKYGEQLRDLKQGRDESVQGFNIRFLCILNKLTCVITNENPQAITRWIIIEAAMRKVGRNYLKGLRHDIGRILLANEISSFSETEKKAADIEGYLREEQKEWRRACTRPPAMYNQRSNRPTQTNNRLLATTSNNNPINKNVPPFSKTKRIPLADRQQVKCFKCNISGHVASECQNVQLTSERNLPPPRVNQIETDEREDQQRWSRLQCTTTPDYAISKRRNSINCNFKCWRWCWSRKAHVLATWPAKRRPRTGRRKRINPGN